jgi:hypothetical protein
MSAYACILCLLLCGTVVDMITSTAAPFAATELHGTLASRTTFTGRSSLAGAVASVSLRVASPSTVAGPLISEGADASVAGGGTFGASAAGAAPFSGKELFVLSGYGCAPGAAAAAGVKGRVALVARGSCGFDVKVRRLEDLGAVGVVVEDAKDSAALVPMQAPGSTLTVAIPVRIVAYVDGQRLRSAAAAAGRAGGVPVLVTVAIRSSETADALLALWQGGNLSGMNETVLVGDSGLDVDNCFFKDAAVNVT